MCINKNSRKKYLTNYNNKFINLTSLLIFYDLNKTALNSSRFYLSLILHNQFKQFSLVYISGLYLQILNQLSVTNIKNYIKFLFGFSQYNNLLEKFIYIDNKGFFDYG